MLIVIALGGNALLQRGETPSAANQLKHAAEAAKSIAAIAQEHDVLLCHGNGPQVGLLASMCEQYKNVPNYPFDVLIAESQGMIGYILQNALKNQLPEKNIAPLLTQVEVDPSDPAFSEPTKFIGTVFENEAELKAQGVPYAQDGKGFRRVIASPKPKAILELKSIQVLLEKKHLVICNGGGGIPVKKTEQGHKGVEAVIDKDATSSLLAQNLNADRLIILTDIEYVYRDFGKDTQSPLKMATADMLSHEQFAKGSMGPKIRAACDFVRATGKTASIGHLSQANELLNQTAGTHITP